MKAQDAPQLYLLSRNGQNRIITNWNFDIKTGDFKCTALFDLHVYHINMRDCTSIFVFKYPLEDTAPEFVYIKEIDSLWINGKI